jgi:hypothetical protein
MGYIMWVLAAFVIGVVVIFNVPTKFDGDIPLLPIPANLMYLGMVWVAIRSSRGLFIATQMAAIENPRTLWIWTDCASER